ncbi:MAG: linear amide C-N hydrolase [Deltaproteobacteria bacterium]|nr:linear amide C-N hydrolase [Deltaproteobacteria bacterium]
MACSEVYIGGTQNISARNFDFMVGDGIALLTPRGQTHESGYASKGEDKLSWVSRYGSLSFWVKLPGCKENAEGGYVLAGLDGMNEKGFKVGTYFLETSEFAEGSKGTTLAITSLMQYLLDNFETVDKALKDLQHPDYRVIPVPTGAVPVKLHFYLHDFKGDSAIVEFIDSKVVLHKNPEVTVLTNTAYKGLPKGKLVCPQRVGIVSQVKRWSADSSIPF